MHQDLATIVWLLVAICTAAVWLAVAFAFYRAYRSWQRGVLLAAVIWLALAFSPFVTFAVKVALAPIQEARRKQEVAAFERAPFPSVYPSTLEVHGYLTTRELLMYLDMLAIDIVYVFQSKAFRGTLNATVVELRASCRGRGRQHLEARRLEKDPPFTERSDDACLIRTEAKIDAARDHVPAILFLMDANTTLRLPGPTWAGGNYEVRLRTGEGNGLIDYWERPHIVRPASPWTFVLGGFAQRANSDWRNYRMNRIDFFARAVGL